MLPRVRVRPSQNKKWKLGGEWWRDSSRSRTQSSSSRELELHSQHPCRRLTTTWTPAARERIPLASMDTWLTVQMHTQLKIIKIYFYLRKIWGISIFPQVLIQSILMCVVEFHHILRFQSFNWHFRSPYCFFNASTQVATPSLKCLVYY